MKLQKNHQQHNVPFKSHVIVEGKNVQTSEVDQNQYQSYSENAHARLQVAPLKIHLFTKLLDLKGKLSIRFQFISKTFHLLPHQIHVNFQKTSQLASS